MPTPLQSFSHLLFYAHQTSMDNSLSYNILPRLLLPFLSLLSSISLSSAAYTLPQHHFINCGSSSSIRVYGLQTFVGDANTGIIASGKTSPFEDSSSSNSTELYRTARVFINPSVYELDIVQNGTYVVRFHFFPFAVLGNLSNARFSVEVSIFRVLSNFSIRNSSVSNFPLIEEFLLQIPIGKLKIRFLPDDGDDSFAFVNAMEVFLAPPDSARGSSVLHVIHRINVGGSNVMRNSDKLFRNWIPDDSYLLNKEIAKNSDPYNGNIYYQIPDYQEFVAPTSVYNTAKELSIGNGSSQMNSSRIPWRFDVNARAVHLVRLHFCDIVSNTSNEFLKFDLFINGYSTEVFPYSYVSRTAAAFYIDHEVDSDDSGFVNISVGPKIDSTPRTAFLNGLEIFEVVNELGSKSGGNNLTTRGVLIIIGSCVGGFILVVICLTLYYLCLRKKGLKPADPSVNRPVPPLFVGSSHGNTTDKTASGSSELNLGLRVPLSEILFATKNFDSKLVIGEGGFGKVYEGMWRNGTKVAVKRSDQEENGQGLSEFETEIIVLSRIRHHHLVSLIGYCDEGGEMILVYEFMEKGTLREHLYVVEGEKRESKPVSELSWEQRLGICIGAAKGIHYLHTGSSGAFIHRDIKSTNILLDGDYVAKVADFGLSRLGPLDDQTHVSTAVKGSFGYFDPDYFRCLQLTQKSDVFSFGVVLLEVICARAVIDPLLPREQISLSEWGLSVIKKGQLETIVDPFLVGKINPNSFRKFGETVEKCLEEYGGDRPNMVDVLWDLEYCLQLQHTAAPRAPYEDSTTDVALGIQMNVLQRLPSLSISMGNDSCNFSEAFSQMIGDEVK